MARAWLCGLAGLLVRATLGAALLTGSACDTIRNNFLGGAPSTPTVPTGFVQGFLGAVVADEPNAAIAGRDILAAGGTAADAAVAVGLMLAVTLPSRAGMGGGGVCLAYAPRVKEVGLGRPEAILFTAPAAAVAGGDRPAAVPMLVRGLFALHARYGKRPFEELIAPAEQTARFGVAASRALARDVSVVVGALAGDPLAAAIFLPGGQPLAAGATLRQPDLASTLAQVRTSGVGDLYQGVLSHRFADASALAGGPVTVADLRISVPRILPAITVESGDDLVAVPPTPGGLGTAATLMALRSGDGMAEAQQRGLAVAAATPAEGADASLLASRTVAPVAPPVLPASASFATLDKDGHAVICAVSMNNLFGTGRIAPGTGVLLAASPQAFPPPLLAVALAFNENIHAFRAEAAGTGQAAAALAAGLALGQELGRVATPQPAPEPGRANLIACNGYLPAAPDTCSWRADPRSLGLGLGSDQSGGGGAAAAGG